MGFKRENVSLEASVMNIISEIGFVTCILRISYPWHDCAERVCSFESSAAVTVLNIRGKFVISGAQMG
jgi:hypothetical protein